LSEAAPLVGSSLDLGVFFEDEDFLLGERSLASPSSALFTFSTNFSKSSILAPLTSPDALTVTPTSKMGFLSSTASIYSILEKSSSSFLMASEATLSSTMGDNSTFVTMSSIKGEFYSEITFFLLLSGDSGINFFSFNALDSATMVTAAAGYSGFAESASIPSDGIW